MPDSEHFAPPGPLGFGGAPLGNMFEEVTDEQAEATLGAAWDAGVRYFDTAPHYGPGISEHRFGHALRDRPRDAFVLSTKVGRLLRADAGSASVDGVDVAIGTPIRTGSAPWASTAIPARVSISRRGSSRAPSARAVEATSAARASRRGSLVMSLSFLRKSSLPINSIRQDEVQSNCIHGSASLPFHRMQNPLDLGQSNKSRTLKTRDRHRAVIHHEQTHRPARFRHELHARGGPA